MWSHSIDLFGVDFCGAEQKKMENRNAVLKSK